MSVSAETAVPHRMHVPGSEGGISQLVACLLLALAADAPMVEKPAWDIVEYRGRQGLARLESDWKRLTAAMPKGGAHHTYQSHAAYFRHLSPAQDRFSCFALTDGRRIRAICPLELKTVKILGWPTRVWGLPWNEHNLIRDVICPPDEARRVLLPSLVRFLSAAPGRPAWVLFDRVLETSAVWDCLRNSQVRALCSEAIGGSDLIDCDRSFEEVSSQRSSKHRSNLRKAHSKLAAHADARFEHATDPLELAREFDSFLEVEASGWKGDTGTHSAVRLHPKLVAFYKDLMASLDAGARCEINSLYADGRCIASEFCIRTGTEYASLKIAFDERYGSLAPGKLLVENTFERCCRDPVLKRLSFVTHQDWHRDWRPQVVPVHCVYVGLGRWSGPVLAQILGARFEYGPRVKRWLLQSRPGSRILGWLRPGKTAGRAASKTET